MSIPPPPSEWIIPHSNRPQHPLSGKLWLGLWQLSGDRFGHSAGPNQIKLIQTAVNEGIYHIDTSFFYAKGRANQLLTQAINDRSQLFISTKVGLEWVQNSVAHNASPEGLNRLIHLEYQSLYQEPLDLIHLHWPDSQTSITDSLRHLKKSPYAKSIGLCNTKVPSAIEYPSTFQHVFNPLQAHHDIFKYHHQLGIKTIAYSPFAQGLLLATNPEYYIASLGRKDWRRRNPIYQNNQTVNAVYKIQEHINESQIPATAFILLWILHHPYIDAVIIGPKYLHQLDSCLQILKWEKEFQNYLDQQPTALNFMDIYK